MGRFRWFWAAVALFVVWAGLTFAKADSYFANGSGTRDDPYLLENASDLCLMRDLFNRDPLFAADAPCFRLSANIRLNEEARGSFDWQPIKRFTGELDGAGFAVTGLYVTPENATRVDSGSREQVQGCAFIAEIAKGARVRGLTLSGSVEAPGASGLALAGGFACVNRGTVENCVSYVTLVVTRKAGSLWLSGVAAVNEGRLLRCTDRSRLYIYPDVNIRPGDIRYSGLMTEGGGTAESCADESRNEGIAYPSVWNLYEPEPISPSPMPATPSPTPSSTPVPSATPAPSPAPTSAAQSATPAPSVNSPSPTTSVPFATGSETALSALAEAVPDTVAALDDALYSLAGALGALQQREGDYLYRCEGRSATLMAYTGPGGCVSVPKTLGGFPVTRIAAGAFANKAQLRELTLPDGVLAIGEGAFSGCAALYYIHFPEALTALDLAVLAGCDSLSAVDLPQGLARMSGDFPVTGEGLTAWVGDNNTAAVYCREQGVAVRMQRFLRRDTAALQNITIRFRPTAYSASGAAANDNAPGKGASGKDADASMDGFSWADTAVNGSAIDYQHTLARLSLGAALAAQPSTAGENGARAQQNAVALLLELGFRDIRCFGYTGGSGITLVLAQKPLQTAAGKDRTVVVALPGGGGEAGWIATLRAGDTAAPAAQRGLQAAADDAYARLQAYLAEAGLQNDDVALWLAGFGRAGAVGGLLAARWQAEQADEGRLYAYLFGAPSITAMGTSAVGLYSILCQSDLVPALPPAAWGLGQAGTVYAFPSAQAGDAAAVARYGKMLSTAAQIQIRGAGTGVALPFARLLGEGDANLLPIRDYFLRLVAFTAPSPQVYAQGYSAVVARAVRGASGDWQRALRSLDTLLNAPTLSLLQGAPGVALPQALAAYFRSVASAQTTLRLNQTLAAASPAEYASFHKLLAGESMETDAFTSAELTDCALPALRDAAELLASMHCPELYLGWMMSLDESEMVSLATAH